MVNVEALERRTGVPREIWMALAAPQVIDHDGRRPPKPIVQGEAARKYGIYPRTLSRWADKGIVRALKEPDRPGDERLLDENDVERVASEYLSNPGRGKRTAVLNGSR